MGKENTNESVYGLIVVLGGFVVVLAAFFYSAHRWEDVGNVTAAMGSITGVVGTQAGAFFGVHVGAAGKDKAEQERDVAQGKVEKLAAMLPPDQALRALNIEQ